MGPVAAGVVVAAGYALGTLPIALVVGRRAGVDPTAAGSGNPGASNVFRTAGRSAGLQVLLGDLAKGAAAAGLGWAVAGRSGALLAGLAAVVGHVAPVTRRLRGGKGVATAGGAVLVAFPVPGLVAAVVWAVVAGATRVAAVASLAAVATIVVGVAAVGPPAGQVGLVAAIAVVVAARHRSNLRRLVAGREHSLGAGSS